jgi:multiple sugar transport system substrate-binding protein
VLKQSIMSARPRPVSSKYDQVSLAISSAVSDALNLRKPSDETVAALKQQLSEIIRNQ